MDGVIVLARGIDYSALFNLIVLIGVFWWTLVKPSMLSGKRLKQTFQTSRKISLLINLPYSTSKTSGELLRYTNYKHLPLVNLYFLFKIKYKNSQVRISSLQESQSPVIDPCFSLKPQPNVPKQGCPIFKKDSVSHQVDKVSIVMQISNCPDWRTRNGPHKSSRQDTTPATKGA